eukprot:TRINITY_DN27704_c0_g1_i1.p1 TRINITY_DN27704_c0_g1~~TRINITY_DN27704_c0_g1_i1.p1  ORF type:complete len:572 (+),score=193.00 TRINITY_DN27704_c0_g1_i1:60-1775(+)
MPRIVIDDALAPPPRQKTLRSHVHTALLPLRNGRPAVVSFAFLNLGMLLMVMGMVAADAMHPPAPVAPVAPIAPPRRPAVMKAARVDAAAAVTSRRRKAVKNMFRHAWKGYKEHAWGMDELIPGSAASAGSIQSFGGWGVTMVDALDTLILLGMKEEEREAREWLATMNYTRDYNSGETSVSVFETVIRHLGGLLGAYTLSPERAYLEKAVELADLLMPTFQPGERSFAAGSYDLAHQAIDTTDPCLADVGSKQLEFSYLSMLTGDPKYAQAANYFYEHVHNLNLDEPVRYSSIKGLYPTWFGGMKLAGDRLTFGGQADSFYEYLLKVYLLHGEQDPWLYALYEDAVDAALQHLVFKDVDDRTYVASLNGRSVEHHMDHLSCFLGAMFALGAGRDVELELAKNVTATCYAMYATSRSGLGAEDSSFSPKLPQPVEAGAYTEAPAPFRALDNKYILRPEAIEAIYYMWTLTGDPMYREWAWDMYLAIERYCKRDVGYTGVNDVDHPSAEDDTGRMESFFLAETVKYLYLTFTDENPVPFEDYVFNTEAHPFRRLPGGNVVQEIKRRHHRRAQ